MRGKPTLLLDFPRRATVADDRPAGRHGEIDRMTGQNQAASLRLSVRELHKSFGTQEVLRDVTP